MDIKTENLTILFVDIAGFTATTSRQSRAENAHLLQTFDGTLLPLIKRFKGIVVKSIGDALLITFRSPTDAMLCSMALQDAMHEYNLNAPEEKRIHIRVAANLGEVRITKKDIFGEPVNVASRIEGVAPADEIYLSEAVFMAMNKAEVPAQEVGFKELKGIPQAIRIYSIPRFATPRLIPERVAASGEQGSELLFPYGGMHHRMPQSSSSRPGVSLPGGIPKYVMILAAIAVVFGGMVLYRVISEGTRDATVSSPPDSAVIETKKSGTAGTLQEGAKPPKAVSGKTEKPRASSSVTADKTEHVKWSAASAKSAYQAEKISKSEYKRIVRELKEKYGEKIRNLKQDYRAKKISRDVYENEVRKAKREYAGS